MKLLILLTSLILCTLASTQCTCSGGTLADSYNRADAVFAAFVQGTYGKAQVSVTEIFKESTFGVNDFIYIEYSCGNFPARIGEEAVFFTTAPTNAGGSFVVQLLSCTRNGVVTREERNQLRNGVFGTPTKCVDASGTVYSEGQDWKQDCNACVCINSEPRCTTKSCGTSSPTTGCVSDDGQVIPEGASFKQDCNTCVCSRGALICTEMACSPAVSGYCIIDGQRTAPGEVLKTKNGCTRRWRCEDGTAELLQDSCSTSPTSSKYFIIGISLASAVVVVILLTIVAIVRKRIRAREASNGGILLDALNNIDSESDSDYSPPKEQVPAWNATNNYTQSPYVGNPSGQMFAPGPMWGGQPLATTPIVLMTQTGEPVVVQVAYM